MERHWQFRFRLALIAAAMVLVGCSETSTPNAVPPQSRDTDPLLSTPVPAGEIDMAANADFIFQGAIFRQSQFETSAGTGLVNPFLKTNTNDEAFNAFNTSGTKPNTVTGGGSDDTRDLPLNYVPQVSIDPDGAGGVGPQPYREIRLDINQNNNVPASLLSLDEFIIHISSKPLIPTNASNLPDFAAVAGSNPLLVYDLDAIGDSWLKMDGDLQSGSGQGDIFFYIPEAAFGAAGTACPFDGAVGDCGKYLYLTARFGDHYINNDGFEEFAVRKLPYATKTAEYFFDNTVTWDIEKKIKKSTDATFVDGPITFDLWNGQSGTANYQVSVDKTVSQTNNHVDGTITVINPMKQDITNVAVTDVFAGVNGQVTCPSTTVIANSQMVCTYTVVLGVAPTLPDTNRASVTATINNQLAIFAPAKAGIPLGAGTLGQTTGFNTINVQDVLGAATTNLGSASDDKTFSTYNRTFTCDADRGTKTNTATIVETNDSDQATAEIKCYSLDVTKTATPAQGDDYDWAITKTVTPAARTMYRGDQGEFEYTVSFDKTKLASSHSVSGTVTVANPATSSGDISVAQPTDQILANPPDPLINVTLDCGAGSFPRTLAPGASFQCSYGPQALPDGDTRTNRASAQGTIGASNNKSFSGDATIDFTGVVPTSSHNSAAIGDPNDPSGIRGPFTDDGNYKYIVTYGCDADAGTKNNTATLRSAGTPNIVKTASASITITCLTPTVAKTALTSYRRTWAWEIIKSRGLINGEEAPSTLVLQPAQTFVYPFSVQVRTTGFEDDLAEAHGTITVTGKAGVPNVRTFQVSDAMDGFTPAVDCDAGAPVTDVGTITAGGVLSCTWSQDLDDDITGRTNTATATLTNVKYQIVGGPTALATTTAFSSAGTPVTFGAPSTRVDDCVTIADLAQHKDAQGGNLGTPIGQTINGTLCVAAHPATSADQTYNYTTTIGPMNTFAACGTFRFDNTATITTNTSGTTDDSSLQTPITVDCPVSCTLTQGYWKTHNESFGANKKTGRKGPPVHVFSGAAAAWDRWDLWRFFGGTPVPVPTGVTAVADPPDATGNQPSWFKNFSTPPAGNPYYQASHQFMAAMLNLAAGSPGGVIDSELGDAYDFFKTANPNSLTAGEKSQLLIWASSFAAYNEGRVGTEHCSEDGTSSLVP